MGKKCVGFHPQRHQLQKRTVKTQPAGKRFFGRHPVRFAEVRQLYEIAVCAASTKRHRSAATRSSVQLWTRVKY
jgi:hypothetical protein